MRLILLGPPGCGKGTQAALLCQRNNLEHIGTGDLLRAAVRLQTPAGIRAQPYVAAGKLAPDDLVNDIVAERFRDGHGPERFVLDGYPRTLAQALAFDEVMQRHKLDLTAVLLLTVSDEEIVQRLKYRWSCPKPGCLATYHTVKNPPKLQGVCDRCGTALVQREDDKEDTVRARLLVYHKNTEGLISYYRQKGLLKEIQGEGEIEQVYQAIMAALKPEVS
jgi:adenylate kinase